MQRFPGDAAGALTLPGQAAVGAPPTRMMLTAGTFARETLKEIAPPLIWSGTMATVSRLKTPHSVTPAGRNPETTPAVEPGPWGPAGPGGPAGPWRPLGPAGPASP